MSDEKTVAELLEGQPNVITPAHAWEPTLQLRWSRSGALQQMWRHVVVDRLVEWRDVPTEEASEGGE